MFPSSAAMLKNLQQSAMASPSFLMENLLQSSNASSAGGPANNGADFTSLTLNWAASLVARQREREARCSESHELREADHSALEAVSPRPIQLSRQSHDKLTGAGGLSLGDEPPDSKSVLQLQLVDSDTDAAGSALDRLSAMERLSERIENRSSSAMDSNNSMDEDRGSGPEMDAPLDAASPPTRFADFARQQQQQQLQQQQHQQELRFAESAREDRLLLLDGGSRISEETCSCGDDQCQAGPACRRIQQKEKPQLKFSVNAILGGNHDRRPNHEHFQGIPPGALPAFLHNLQNSTGYSIAKPIPRPAAYHPHHPPHPGHHGPQQHHIPPNAHHTLHQLLGCRTPYLTVANPGGGNHQIPGSGAGFPSAMQAASLGDLTGMSLGFPWAGSARGKPRRGMMRRAVFSDHQRRGLEKRFQVQKYISKPDRKKLAEKLGLKDSQVTYMPY
ncbi:hypothetical protein TKK_0014015 [Trichogramma kaykai]